MLKKTCLWAFWSEAMKPPVHSVWVGIGRGGQKVRENEIVLLRKGGCWQGPLAVLAEEGFVGLEDGEKSQCGQEGSRREEAA